MDITEQTPNKIGLGFIVSWGLGGILVIGGIIKLVTTPVLGIFTLLAGLVIFPPATTFLKKKTDLDLSKVAKIIFFFVLLGIGCTSTGASRTPSLSSNTSAPVVNTTDSDKAQSTATTQPENPKRWVTVIEASGTSAKRTDTFSLQGGRTRLTYTFNGGDSLIGSIYVIAEGHSLQKKGGFPEVSVTKPGTDSTFLTKDAGTYYLDVSSANTSWTIKIEEER